MQPHTLHRYPENTLPPRLLHTLEFALTRSQATCLQQGPSCTWCGGFVPFTHCKQSSKPHHPLPPRPEKNVFLVSTEEVQGLQSAPVQCSTVCAARGRANSETTPSSQSSARATNNAHRLSSVSLHYFIIYISSRYTLTIVCVYILQENEMEKRI